MSIEDLTPNEIKILLAVRQLQPHERIEIVADQKGREDYYIVTKTLREILN